LPILEEAYLVTIKARLLRIKIKVILITNNLEIIF